MTDTTARLGKLGVFSLAMITVGSVDSIRNLPAMALFGSSLIFFFVLAALFFLLPSALVCSELASTNTEHGGLYVWIRQAFGVKTGFIAVWFQWISNVIWYPTVLSFIAATVGYLISPTLIDNKVFLMTVILVTFWGTTLINLLGIAFSARFANFCAVGGLILPMSLIIGLGVVWWTLGKPVQIDFSVHSLLPHLEKSDTWVALIGIMLSFCGMEIATVHGFDVKNPARAYPRAMMISVIIIVITLLLGALSIASVLPEKMISLVAGIMQAFDAFFSAYHLQWILPIMAVILVIGGLGGVNNWVIAPTRGLQLAIRDVGFSRTFSKNNRHGAPQALLIFQAVIASLISIVFLLMPSVNGSYWLLTVLTSQLYMLMYLILFAAGIRLRYKKIPRQKGFMLPGKTRGMWIVGGAGLIGSFITLLVGFIPPGNINVGSVAHYEMLLLLGLLVMSLPPLVVYYWHARRRI